MRRLGGLLSVIGCLALSGACTGPGTQGPRSGHESSRIPSRSVSVGCAAAVSGRLGNHWRAHAQKIGAAYLFAAPADPSTMGSSRRLPQGVFVKVLVVVEPGEQVALRIDPPADASLLYGPNPVPADHRPRVEDGAEEVQFRACPRNRTQFAGGIITQQTGGVELTVTTTSEQSQIRVG